MIKFKSFLLKENTTESRRQGIMHFQQMKPEDFVLWIRSVKESQGILKDIKSVMKIDGLGARFGKNSQGRIYFEGSRTGPVFDSGVFSSYARAKTEDVVMIARAEHYDNMLEIFKNAPFMKVCPNNAKIICEIFYNPMSNKGHDGGLVFVHVSYDKNKLGTAMTIMPYNVVISSTGMNHPDENQILKNLYEQSNETIKIINPNLKFNTIDISMFIKPIEIISDQSLSILKSKKANDKIEKQNLLNLIQKMKDDLADYLLAHPNIEGKFKLGPNLEGIVLHLPTKAGITPFKITTSEFKAIIKQKKEDVNA